MQTFDHDEQAYLAYIAHHPDHFILNVPRTGSSFPIYVHIAACGTISTPKRRNYTTTEFFKIAFPSRDEAIAHAQGLAGQRGIGWQVCQRCKAEPKR